MVRFGKCTAAVLGVWLAVASASSRAIAATPTNTRITAPRIGPNAITMEASIAVNDMASPEQSSLRGAQSASGNKKIA